MADRRRVLITGAAGFVGRHACAAFRAAGWHVTAAARLAVPPGIQADATLAVGDLAATTLDHVVAGLDCVVHLAGRAHRMRERERATADRYHADNVESTRRLAEAAGRKGVGRFVFVSTAKVLGEEREQPYTACDQPDPRDHYARSKLAAEQALQDAAGVASLEFVILRPPMVYGPGGAGNVPRLVRLARVGRVIPLPFGAVENRRSLIFVGNLADALVHCAQHAQAAGATFLVSDGEDVSTPELLRRLARADGGTLRTVRVPPRVLSTGANLLGREADARRLLGSLAVDTTLIESRLGWSRPYSLDAGLRATVRGSPGA